MLKIELDIYVGIPELLTLSNAHRIAEGCPGKN
jgi:hypothetical protein